MATQKPFVHDEPIAPVDEQPPTEEGKFHGYLGNDIPWYVRFIWILFWAFAIGYLFMYCLPALQREIGSPP